MPALVQEHPLDRDVDQDIAVIGLDLKFPGDAISLQSFSDMLVRGQSALSEVPPERYNIDAFYHPDPERAGSINIRKAHHVKGDLAAFDAPFFSITPAEAACMDPQQRGLLESVYRALENAGIPMSQATGSDTSVYIGCFTREYDGVITRDPEVDLKYIATGTGTTMISNRISWFFDFHGASMTLDTACSSSLMACHLACTNLRTKESNMAVVGGCNLFYNPDTCIPLTSLGFLSPDAKCYSFDHRANGYSRGEGFGILLLKRMRDALRDGDTIRAVIRSTVANQDGKSPGITQPTRDAQVAATQKAYTQAGLDPALTRYFEAHGTGTPVGDPIEASAIGQVFHRHRSQEEPLYVGAVKSNIGHLEGAAGIAGLMKAIAVLESGVIPPNIWFEKPNPKISPNWNLAFPTSPIPWPSEGLRRASINSFGYGGSNAHVVMDDALHYLKDRSLEGRHHTSLVPALDLSDKVFLDVDDPTAADRLGGTGDTKPNMLNFLNELNGHTHTNGPTHPSANGTRPESGNGLEKSNGHVGPAGAHQDGPSKVSHGPQLQTFVFSSFDEDGVARQMQALHDHLCALKVPRDEEAKYLQDLCHTLNNKRTHHQWRSSVVASTINELRSCLGMKAELIKPSANPRLALVFTGQGAQYYDMGRQLMQFSTFAKSLQAATDYLHDLGCHWDLLDEFARDEISSKIQDPEYSQPVCTALQIALVELLSSRNVVVDAVVGHSSGEIAAAYAAGAISRSSAWRIAYHRGLLSAKLARSPDAASVGMLTVGLSAADTQQELDTLEKGADVVTIACHNSPNNTTLSGDNQTLDQLKQRLESTNVFVRKLNVENAYHSRFMNPIADEYRSAIGRVKPGVPLQHTPRFYSSLEGRRMAISDLTHADYWVQNLVSPVLFSQAVSMMVNDSAPRAKKLGAQRKFHHLTELVELGPHAALRGPIREILDQSSSPQSVAYSSLLRRGAFAVETYLSALGWLHCRGHTIDLETMTEFAGPQGRPSCLVDLPSYQFNHEKRYWVESRLSKGYRFRKEPRHELLGAPVPDWDKSNAIWRNWVRLSENPWVADHRVTGSTLYPAAGMLVMAIEASRQLALPDKVIKGFRFKEVVLHMALRVPLRVEGVETHFHMRPYLDSTSLTSSSWSEFELRSFEGDAWVEHCRGLIQTEYETPYTPVDNGLEDQLFNAACTTAVSDAEKGCQEDVSVKQMYEILQTVGFDFGPTFQNLSDVRIDEKRTSIATVQAPDIASKMAFNHVQPHLIHPTTLDGCFQSVVVAMTRGGKDMGEVMIPTSFREIWISGQPHVDHTIHRVQAKAEFLGLRQAEASFVSVDPRTGKPLVVVDGFVSTAVSQKGSFQNDSSGRHVCFNIDWKPDPMFLQPETAATLFEASEEVLNFDPSQLIENLELLCFLYMKRYMKTCTSEMISVMKPHHQKYVAWMQYQFERFEKGQNMHAQPNWDALASDADFFHTLERRMENASPESILTVAVGRAMPQVLAGELDPLQVLFHESRAENVYKAATGAEISYQRLSAYVDVLAHKDPSMRILEIGAGTGGITHPMLQTLTNYSKPSAGNMRFASYDFTDISPSFFEKARETFSYAVDRMNFRVLNVENDPVQQGFELDKYDLVVAANVFHATKSLDVTLQNVCKLMKPGGQLLLYEITNNTLMQTGFGFGLLPGWWLSEEAYRQWSPLLTVPDWATHLKRNGFDGLDFAFSDYVEARNHVSSLMISTASSGEKLARARRQITVIVQDESQKTTPFVSELILGLKALLGETSDVVTLESWRQHASEQALCIFLGDFESSFFRNMHDQDWERFKTLTKSTHSLLWITRGGGRNCPNPDAEMITGLSRTIRAENPVIKLITMTVQQDSSAKTVVQSVVTLVDTIFLKGDKRCLDNAFSVEDGILHVPRITEAHYMNEAITSRTSRPRPYSATLGSDPSRALKLVVGSPGLLDSLHFVDDPLYEEPLQPDQVEFKVMASGLNFLDIMVSLGQVIGNQIGIEGAGVVTRTGPDSRFKPGDRVCGMLRGSVKTFARTVDKALARIPDELSFTTAATLPVVYVTAYCVLYDIANIQPGESVLIHAAAGGVGQACIQLAHLRGAEVYATVGSLEKTELLMKEYGIPRDHIFSSRDLTFAKGVKRMTKGRGVDVIVNALSGPALRATWDCIAPFGRFVEIGKVDIYSSARLNMEKFKNNVRFEFLDVSYFGENHHDKFNVVLSAVMELVANGQIHELRPITVYPMSQLEQAFRYMQSGMHSGKIVLEPHDEDEVMMLPSQRPKYSFDPNASYVISGGLGGLGRSMARWMVKRGARHLILLSRSGASRETAQELIKELQSQGVRIATPPCDVTDLKALQAALSDCATSMPTIKGCIQGSMVLKDALFANMTLDDFNTALKPKVHASWNLHTSLPKNLDFFILLSSGSGIVGKGGQANYCAGNTYQDALARYRVSEGLKATVLDLGIILSVGYAAERVDVMGHLRAQGYAALREEEYHAMLDELCDPNRAIDTTLESQISLGFELPETLRSKGIEFPSWMHDPLFKHLHEIRTTKEDVGDSGGSTNYSMLLAGAETREAVENIIAKAIVAKLSRALGMDAQKIDPSQPLDAFGVDSLIAVELRSWLLKEMGAEIAVFDMMGAGTIFSLASLVASRSSMVRLNTVTD